MQGPVGAVGEAGPAGPQGPQGEVGPPVSPPPRPLHLTRITRPSFRPLRSGKSVPLPSPPARLSPPFTSRVLSSLSFSLWLCSC